jgi:hypothetical protein
METNLIIDIVSKLPGEQSSEKGKFLDLLSLLKVKAFLEPSAICFGKKWRCKFG